MTTTHPENNPRKPLVDAVKRKRENDAWTSYMVAVTDIDADMILAEPVVLIDHEKIARDAERKRRSRIRTLAAESARAYYPLEDNHARINTLLDEMEANR